MTADNAIGSHPRDEGALPRTAVNPVLKRTTTMRPRDSRMFAPSKPLPRVYFAGKISKADWRLQLVPTLDEAEFGVPIPCDGFIYTGPFFIACDHGCSFGPGMHGIDDGCQTAPTPPRWLVPSLCLDWIGRCDLLFAWINDSTCYGTLVEIGWAQMLRKPVYIGFAPRIASGDMWFATEGPRTIGRMHTNAAEALEQALAYGAVVP